MQLRRTRARTVLMTTLGAVAVSVVVTCCGGGGGSANDAGTGDTDSDSDTEADIGSDTETVEETDTGVAGDCNLTGNAGKAVGDLAEDVTLYECDGTPIQIHDVFCRNEYTFVFSFAWW